MIKPSDPRQLAIDLLPRSVCAVRVAAVIADPKGRIVSWGWNSSGRDGLGEHAEMAALRRANRRRLRGASIFVASVRGKPITSRPCHICHYRLVDAGLREIRYMDRDGLWRWA